MAEVTPAYTPPETTTFVFVKQYDDVKAYMFHDSMGLVISIVVVYLLFVLKIGPDFMKNREPYKLRNALIIYNAVQVIISAYSVYLTHEVILLSGLLPRKCHDYDPKIRGKMSFCIYMYWLGKIIDLLDTIFFVLRKKYDQVTFLHVYHHASVMIGTYLVFVYFQGHSAVYCAFINSLVLVVMYFYYGVAALGPEYAKYLTWKKHITNFQRLQFCITFLHSSQLLFYDCGYPRWSVVFTLPNSIFFYYLFFDFYYKAYSKPGDKKTNGKVIANGKNKSNGNLSESCHNKSDCKLTNGITNGNYSNGKKVD